MKPKPRGQSLLARAALWLLGLGIVATVVVPNCMEFRRKARTSEQKSNLGAIRSTQVAYFAEWGVYVGNVPLTPIADRRGHPEGVPWDPNTRFSLLGFAPEGNVYCSYALEGPDWSKTGFTARVECDLDGDGQLEIHIVDNGKTATVDDGRTEIKGPRPNL